MHRAVLRIAGQHRAVVPDGGLVVPPVGEEPAQRPVGVRVRRIVVQRAQEVIHRFVPPAEHEERAAQIHPCRDVFRARRQRFRVALGGFSEAPGAHVEVPEVVEDVRVARLQAQQVVVKRLGRLEVAGGFGAQRPPLVASRGHRLVPDLGEQGIVHRDQAGQLAGRPGRTAGRLRVALAGVESGEFGVHRPGPRGECGGALEVFARRLQLTAPQEQTPDPEFGEGRVRGGIEGSAVAIHRLFRTPGALQQLPGQQVGGRIAGIQLRGAAGGGERGLRPDVPESGGAQVGPAEVRGVAFLRPGVCLVRFRLEAVRLEGPPERSPSLDRPGVFRDQAPLPGDLLPHLRFHLSGVRVRNPDGPPRLRGRPRNRRDHQGRGHKPGSQRGAPLSVAPMVMLRWWRPARFAQASTVTSMGPSPRTVQETVFRDSSAPDPQRRM